MYQLRLWFSLMAAAAGAVLIAASALGQQGSPGTLRVATSTGSVPIEPAWGGSPTLPALPDAGAAWYATCLKLLNFPDTGGRRTSQLVPEAAAFPRVSADGRTYVFTVDARFTRFSDGERVTAANFKHAIDRLARLRSELVGDIVGTEDVGWRGAPTVSGVVVRGSQLHITLIKPDGGFARRVATTPFCAVPVALPSDPNEQLDRPAASAGPYYVAATSIQSFVLRRNPYYHGPRPRRIASIRFEWGRYSSRPFEGIATDVFEGRVDWAPPLHGRDELHAIASRSPNSRTHSVMSLLYLAFVTGPGEPLANVNLRKGLALALDRRAIARAGGYNRYLAFDHFLPPTVPGSRRTRLYSLHRTKANLERARALVEPFLPLKLALFIDNSAPESWVQHGRAIEKSLEDTGVEIDAVFCIRCSWRAERGIHLRQAWTDNADPADFLRSVTASGDERVDRASRLLGPARLAALGKLDIELARDSVPATALSIGTERHLFSRRVGCLEFHRVYGVSLGALCLRKSR